MYCGPRGQRCLDDNGAVIVEDTAPALPLEAGDWVEGLNNFVPGHQGEETAKALERASSGVPDADAPCNNTLLANEVFMFK